MCEYRTPWIGCEHASVVLDNNSIPARMIVSFPSKSQQLVGFGIRCDSFSSCLSFHQLEYPLRYEYFWTYEGVNGISRNSSTVPRSTSLKRRMRWCEFLIFLIFLSSKRISSVSLSSYSSSSTCSYDFKIYIYPLPFDLPSVVSSSDQIRGLLGR